MKIFEPIEIKGMKLKNRIGMSPFLNMPGSEDGSVTDLTIRWFEERAKGGAGLIMTGSVGPALPSPRFLERMAASGMAAAFAGRRMEFLNLGDDGYIPGLSLIHI